MQLREAAVLALLASIPAASCSQEASSPQLIRDVRVFDGEHVLEHRSVLIENGKIRQVGGPDLKSANAAIIEGAGRTLLPGLIDAHVHIPDDATSAARQALAFGVTTQLDMFSAGERLHKIKNIETEDPPNLSALLTAGTGATVPGGHPTQMGGPPIPTISSPDQAQAFVDARIAEGSNYIKIIHDDGSTWTWTTKRVPMLDNATMRALIAAAHKRGKLAVVHILAEQQARDAIDAGADGLAHIFSGDTVSPDFAQFAARHHVFVIPTLSTLYLSCGKSEGPALLADTRLSRYIEAQWKAPMQRAKLDPSLTHFCSGTDAAIRQLNEAHVPILVGTDAPAPGTTYGAAVHGELTLLVRDGLPPMEALVAATSATASAFHLADRGFIKPGMRADLLLVEGDPTKNIEDTRNIVAVWKRGMRLQR